MATVQPALSSLVFLLLLLFLAHERTVTTASTLEDTCKRYAGNEQAGHNYDYCMDTLGGDASADALGLAAHAANIARSAIRSAAERIARLQNAETVPARRDCLSRCVEEYDLTMRLLADAARYAGGNRLQDAQDSLAAAIGAPARCDKAFTDAGQTSPLSTADRPVNEAVELALNVLPTPPPATKP